jgi:hypothetical protein
MFLKIDRIKGGLCQKLTPVLFALLFLGTPIWAQKYEFGLGLGMASYKGDLSPNFRLRNNRAGIQGFFRYNLSPYLSLRANLLWTGIGARDSIVLKDAFQLQRNFYFKGNIRELAATFEYNFFKFRGNRLKRSERFCPFFFAGIAVSNFTVRNNYLPQDDDRFTSTQLVLPFGIGVKTAIAPKLNLTVEFGARKMFSDRLDGIANVPEDPKFRRVNANVNDMYYFAGFSLSYVINGVRCPDVYND